MDTDNHPCHDKRQHDQKPQHQNPEKCKIILAYIHHHPVSGGNDHHKRTSSHNRKNYSQDHIFSEKIHTQQDNYKINHTDKQ